MFKSMHVNTVCQPQFVSLQVEERTEDKVSSRAHRGGSETHRENRSCLSRPQHRGQHSSAHSQACSPACTRRLMCIHSFPWQLTMETHRVYGNKRALHLKWLSWDTLFLRTHTQYIFAHIAQSTPLNMLPLFSCTHQRFILLTHTQASQPKISTIRPLNKAAPRCYSEHMYARLYSFHSEHTQSSSHLR